MTILLSLGVNALVAALPPAGLRPGELFFRGDANADRALDLSDAVFTLAWLFRGGTVPPCLDAADANDDGAVDLSDPVFTLGWLFRGGPEPPAPSPSAGCPGPDPTPDTLDCASGIEIAAFPPEAALFALEAPPPGVRHRTRRELPREGDAFVVPAGWSFVLLVEARTNPVTRAGFSFETPEGGADPARLEVVADRDLGDPAAGGVAAGEPLASRFLQGIDLWRDPIYLLEHVPLRIDGGGALAPSPGRYVFTARVRDDACAFSEPAVLVLDVVPPPRFQPRLWLEELAEGAWRLADHHAGSGNARIARSGGEYRLVLDVRVPRGADPAPPPEAWSLAAEPAYAGEELTAFLEPVPGEPPRLALPLSGSLRPPPGNTCFVLRAGDAESRLTVEVPLDYAGDIQPIWNLHCTGCHEAPNPYKGLELVHPDPQRTWRNIVNVYASEPAIDSVAAILVRPYLPERSYLFHKLRGTHLLPEVAGEGERMPLGGGYLDEAALHLVESWIVQGAPH